MNMSPSLRQVVTTIGLGEENVVAGRSLLDARLAGVRLVEPARSRIDSSEAVALVIIGEIEVWFELALEHFKAAGVAAVFVTGDPAAVVASTRWLADRIGLALVVCPDADPLKLAEDTRRAVMGHESDVGLACADVARRIGGQPCGPDKAVDVVRQGLGVECSVIGADSIVLAGPVADSLSFRTDWLSGQVLRDGDRVLVAVPASIRNPQLGPELWLVAQLDGVTDQRAQVVKAALEVAALGVTAWAATSRLETQQDATARSAALMQLLTSRREMPAHVVEVAMGLGWSLNGWHVALCLRVTEPLPVTMVDSMTERVRAAVHRQQPGAEVVRAGQGWLCWITYRFEPASDVTDAIIASAWQIVHVLPTQMVAGVGSPQRGGAGLVDTLVEAQDLAASAGYVGGRNVVEHARASAARRLVMSAVASAEVSTGSSRLLEPLRDLGGEALLTTLETYLALDSSKAETAAALHLHRNTVTKRLERIEQVLKVDLRDPEVRFALRIACRGRTN